MNLSSSLKKISRTLIIVLVGAFFMTAFILCGSEGSASTPEKEDDSIAAPATPADTNDGTKEATDAPATATPEKSDEVTRGGATRGGKTKVAFTDIEALMGQHCVKCHKWASSYEGLAKYVVAGDPEKSGLYLSVKEDMMPKSDLKLTADEKNMIKQWILDGASAE